MTERHIQTTPTHLTLRGEDEPNGWMERWADSATRLVLYLLLPLVGVYFVGRAVGVWP